jgi:hypothetical protein
MIAQQTTHEAGRVKLLTRHVLSTIIVLSSTVVSAVYIRGRSLGARLSSIWAEMAASLRTLADTASLAEAQAEGGGDKSGMVILGLSGVALALVIGAIVLLCILPVCILIVLALLGPAIGNVFSDINENI